MDLTLLGGLDILPHHGFEIQFAFAKHLTWPSPWVFACRGTLNHQMTGRPANRWQLFLGSVLFWYEAQVNVNRLARLFSRLNCGFWRIFFSPHLPLATGRHLAECV